MSDSAEYELNVVLIWLVNVKEKHYQWMVTKLWEITSYFL
jgi:hypothetical protein